MGTNANAMANATQTRSVQSSVFDLDSMSTVTLKKSYEFKPVENSHQALERLGNDTARLLAVINRGLQSFEDQAIKDNAEVPWQVEDEDGKLSPFSGTPADDKAVNALVLSMAKASFGYLQAKDADEKRASKDKALAFIKSNPVLIEGMKQQLAAMSETSE